MVRFQDVQGLLRAEDQPTEDRPPERVQSIYQSLPTYKLPTIRSYKQQYGDMYFLRLAKMKPTVEAVALAAWDGTVIGGEAVRRVERVLDVRQGELCWVTGTVYMEMAGKPDLLDDVIHDRWISGPVTVDKYFTKNGGDQILLEDDSGRIPLVGDLLKNVNLVTGCIVAVMGTENANGEMEVMDLEFANMAPQPERWTVTPKPETPSSPAKIVAFVSGLGFSALHASHTLHLQLLLQYLLGEIVPPCTTTNDASSSVVPRISRLIIAGNSISPQDTSSHAAPGPIAAGESKKYGYDSSTFNAAPTRLFDEFLAELLPSIPVTLLPGFHDPANASYPQQPIHPAVLDESRRYVKLPAVVGEKEKEEDWEQPGWLDTTTNPFDGEVEGWRMMGTSGENVDDVCKYVETDDRLGVMEAMCQWRCIAPTAPDTLWSYPFQEDDPFLLSACPHLFFAGNQPEFGTRVSHGPDGQKVRLLALPAFQETHEIALVDMETLEVERVVINVASPSVKEEKDREGDIAIKSEPTVKKEEKS